jgi:hypothetical protein
MLENTPATHERILKAIEAFWGKVIEIREYTSVYLIIYSILNPDEYNNLQTLEKIVSAQAWQDVPDRALAHESLACSRSPKHRRWTIAGEMVLALSRVSKVATDSAR